MTRIDLTRKNDCSQVPSLVSAFLDTFVDYAVGGQFLHPQPSDLTNDTQEGLPGPFVKEKKEIEPLTRIPAPERLIAIGDIHGDLKKAKEALQIAEVMDENGRWIGGESVVVQVGDLLDRGGEEIKVIYLFEKLKREARRQGGDVHIMNGNHEIMNIEGDFHYATPAGVNEFKCWADWYKMGNVLKERCTGLEKPYDFFQNIPGQLSDGCKARMAALRPGGPITSRFLAPHPTVLVVGGTVFVHGGLLPRDVNYGLEKINNETREWMQGKTRWRGPRFLHGPNSLLWLRIYSEEEEKKCDCDDLERALGEIPGAKRMVMGHTIQRLQGINAVCSKKAVRVDVGMSEGCINSAPEVLEIQNDQVMTVLSAISSSGSMNAEEQKPDLTSLLMHQTPPVKVQEVTPILSRDKFKECVLPPAGFQHQQHHNQSFTHHKEILASSLSKLTHLLGGRASSSLLPPQTPAPPIRRRPI